MTEPENLSSEQRIDQLFNDMAQLYSRLDDPYRCVLESRKLLEEGFRLALGMTPGAATNLADCMRAYFQRPESNLCYKGLAEMTRCELNHYVHDSQKDIGQLGEKQTTDLLNKVSSILCALFKRKVSLPKERDAAPLSDANPEQKKAIQSSARFSLALAGPGTGKTHLIVDRIVYSLHQCGSKRIVGLAFTNEAAKHLQDRFIYKIFGTPYFASASQVRMSTIHSFALNAMKEYLEAHGKSFDYEVVDEAEHKRLKEECGDSEELLRAYLEENKLLTFDMIIDKCLAMLKDRDFLNFVSRPLYEIVIDEAQDLAAKDSQIIAALYAASPSLKIFAVGDQRQNIYAFRSGSINNLVNAIGEKPAIFALSRSYRCPDKVLEFVNRLSFTDCDNVALHNADKKGNAVEYARVPNEEAEIAFMTDRIRRLCGSGADANYSRAAILVPTSYVFDLIGEHFNIEGIPFKTKGGTTEMRRDISAFISFLGCLESRKFSLSQFARSLGCRVPRLGREAGFEDLFDALREDVLFAPFVKLIADGRKADTKALYANSQLLRKTAEDYLSALNSSDQKTIDLIRQFAETAAELGVSGQTELRQKMTPALDSLSKFYDKPSVSSTALAEGSDNYVTVSTIHSAKGHEWDFVFVPGLSEERFPGYRRPFNDETKKFYVACTRTLERLFLLSPESYVVQTTKGSWVKKGVRPSVFLNSIEYFV
jgi:superfamily I DNA/RNA helicase